MKCVTCTKWRPCLSSQRFRDVLTSFNGMTLNSAAVGRRLGLSRTTAMAWIKAYERSGLLWLLPCYGGTRRRLLFLRPGYAETPLGCGHQVSALLEALERSAPGPRFYFWRTGHGRVVPVVMDTGGERLGFLIQETRIPRRRNVRTLQIARERGVIRRGFLLHTGDDAWYSGPAVVSLPIRIFLQDPSPWLLEWRTEWDARRRVGRANQQRRPDRKVYDMTLSHTEAHDGVA